MPLLSDTSRDPGFPVKTKNQYTIDDILSKEGYAFSATITGFTGLESAFNTFATTTVANQSPGWKSLRMRKLKLNINRPCIFEIQYPKDPTADSVISVYPLEREIVRVYSSNVYREFDINIDWPYGASLVLFWQGAILPKTGYKKITATGTLDATEALLYNVVNGSSPVTLTVDTTKLKVGNILVIKQPVANTGTITVLGSSGQVQPITGGATVAQTSTLRSNYGNTDKYIELEWDGTDLVQPIYEVQGQYTGWQYTNTGGNILAEKTILGIGDSIGQGSSGIISATPWDKSHFLNQVTKAYQLVNYDVKGVNRAIQGLTSNGINELILKSNQAYISSDVRLILDNTGMNDYNFGASQGTVDNYSAKLTERLNYYRSRYPLATVIVLGISPAQDVTRQAFLNQLRTAAQTIVSNRQDSKIKYLNLGNIFADPTLFSQYASTDTNGSAVHPNQAGYDLIAQTIVQFCIDNSIIL